MAALAGAALLPFLFAPMPPLIDVPGHIGRFAVQLAPAHSPVLRYFGFHWALTLNLGSDVLVQALAPALGVFRATWLICALTAMLTATGIVAVARTLNPRGASGLFWALLYVFNWPFLWGFLNYALAAALAFWSFAGWVKFAAWPRRRAVAYIGIVPGLMIAHAVGGVLLVVMIAGYEIGRLELHHPSEWRNISLPSILPLASPLSGFVAGIAVWRLFGTGEGGATVWILGRKGEAVLTMLRDQDIRLDIASVAASGLVLLLGWCWGARLRGGAAGTAVAVVLLFLATPSLISGSDRIDTRLAPALAVMLLALQDWRTVGFERQRWIATAGALLLALRFAVTCISFVSYSQRYADELAALDHVRPDSRILNFTLVKCDPDGWRTDRLEHIANLATPLRQAWVNAHWSIGGLQLLDVRYRPAPDYYRDPSQLVWPESCVDRSLLPSNRARRTLVEAVAGAPISKVDYLWLIGQRLPAHVDRHRLRLLWEHGDSELYAIVPTRAALPRLSAP